MLERWLCSAKIAVYFIFYQPQILFDHCTLIWIYLHALQVSVYYAEVIYGGVCMNDCADDSLGVGGGVEAGSSAAAA